MYREAQDIDKNVRECPSTSMSRVYNQSKCYALILSMFGYTVSRTAQTAEISTQTEDHRYGADFDMAKHVADVKPCSDEQAILGCLLLVLLSVSPAPLAPACF